MTKSKKVFLNGVYLPVENANVSVMDRGFLFGDGIYEVIPVYHGSLFRFEAHLERLENSLKLTRIDNPYSRDEWRDIMLPLIDATKDQYIYFQVSRGAAEKRDHAFPIGVKPTVFMMCNDIAPFNGKENGVKAISLNDNRWSSCNIKAITLLGNILLRQQAVENDCAEAVLVRDGYITEGSASNIFAVIDGVLITPPKSNFILAGITRDVILELAAANQISCAEDIISLDALKTASEIWFASSTREILPVVELDGRPVANGKVGQLWYIMNDLLQTYKTTYAEGEK
ncbi:MAG: D-amino acid aminotransferase [Methylococcales bacterium]|nr:D-amino acid aminotransferase [Methylococcales bacterium]MDD5754499.1 D-amino acid aminotransferase [Methylococcales bacterium]